MKRRDFLQSAAGLTWAASLGGLACGRKEAGKTALRPAPTGYGYAAWDDIFRTIMGGFISNALATSGNFAVCDYRNGTILRNFVSASGKTCDSVTRILPALAARIVSPDGSKTVDVDGKSHDLEEVFVSALRAGTDPDNPDFWKWASQDSSDQRQVESSIVAWSLWLTRNKVMDRFSAGERENIQRWLASCTVQPVRENNWALFTAVNHAARMALSAQWAEFQGDRDFFLADLEAVNRMYQGDGWYHDSLDGEEYDYYNFWVFASHTLYWDAMVGDRFPELRDTFRGRIKQLLENAPFLFGGNGSHVLFGRSLIYRWGVPTPMVLAYSMGLWPHSVGLLRRVCNSNLKFLWEAGAWDPENRKLRETLAPGSSRAVCESYINNGHPYWGMQAFFAMSLPKEDPFWSAEEEPLPVERSDFRKVIQAPGILLTGTSASGQVQMFQSRCTKRYPNKYYNFSYSSHFPFNVEMVGSLVPPDNMLSFANREGDYARRDSAYTGRLQGDKALEWSWSTALGGTEVKVETRVYLDGEFQWRVHRVSFGGEKPLTAFETTYPLGLTEDEAPELSSGGGWEYGKSKKSGCAVFVRANLGYDGSRPLQGFRGRENLNSLYPRALQGSVTADLEPGTHILSAVLYASPSPLGLEDILKKSSESARPPEFSIQF